MSAPVAAVVPAAGRGRRFGGRKLLASIDGVAMIERVIRALLEGGVPDVVVVLAADSEVTSAGTDSVPTLGDPRVRTVLNPDPERGMLSSIQAGLAVAGERPVLVLPGDMPFVRRDTVARLADAAPGEDRLISPRHGGERGHPLVVPVRLRSVILEADPGASLKELLEPFKPGRLLIDVDDPGVLRDVDRRSDVEPAGS